MIYLIFNEGYGGRDELADEAVRLGRMLAALMPDEPEVFGLLALMVCHHARRAARHREGEIVLLDQQDRAEWDGVLIAEGRALLDRAIARARGPYVVQAAIAVLHTEPDTDWAQVAALYLELVRLTGSPVAELNRAVAVAQAGAPQAALRITEAVDLDNYPYLHSTRAELLRRLDRPGEAIAAYRRALELVTTEPERRLLRGRIVAWSTEDCTQFPHVGCPAYCPLPSRDGEQTVTAPVTVINEIAIPRERVEEWLRRWRTDYLPGAGERGMRVTRQCRCFTSAAAVTLLIEWELPGIYEFYGMRAAAGAAEDVSRFWQWTDSLALSRERRVLEEIS